MKGQFDFLKTLVHFYEQLQLNWRADLELTYNKDVEPIVYINNSKRLDYIYNIPFSKRIYMTKWLINKNIALLRKICFNTNLYNDYKNLLMLDIKKKKIVFITYDMYGRRKKTSMRLYFNWIEYKFLYLMKLV